MKRDDAIWSGPSSANEKRKEKNRIRKVKERKIKKLKKLSPTQYTEYRSLPREKAAENKTQVEADRVEAFAFERERTEIQNDFLLYYQKCCAQPERDPLTGVTRQQTLSAFHLLMIDYLNLDLPGVKTYSVLHRYLPQRDKFGNFPETWIYFKKIPITEPPQIQRGASGPISKMFYETFWQGAIIKVAGDGKTQGLFAPRWHLKSALGSVAQTSWRIIRNPKDRHVIRNVNSEMSGEILSGIKQPFERTDGTFNRLFGHLKSPDAKKLAWNNKLMQVNIREKHAIGKTVKAMGSKSEYTGGHFERGVCDDIVGESNSQNEKMLLKGCRIVQAMNAQKNVGARMLNIGTPWSPRDTHQQFLGKPGTGDFSGNLAPYSSFMVVTALDGDESVPAPKTLTRLGYGKPIWPEKYGIPELLVLRASLVEDFFWYSQMFCQTIGGGQFLFKREWMHAYPESGVGRDGKTVDLKNLSPQDVALALGLNIYIGIDCASGKPHQDGKLDRTGLVVIGQTQDRSHAYFLDGFDEPLPAELIARGIVERAIRWHVVARSYGGQFRCGYEEEPHNCFLEPLLDYEMKEHGAKNLFPIEPVPHGSVPKFSRARLMAVPYSNGYYYWPEKLNVIPIYGKGAIKNATYDVRAALEREFLEFTPASVTDNLIDAHGVAQGLMLPMQWAKEEIKEQAPVVVAAYTRKNKSGRRGEGVALGCNYDDGQSWGMGF